MILELKHEIQVGNTVEVADISPDPIGLNTHLREIEFRQGSEEFVIGEDLLHTHMAVFGGTRRGKSKLFELLIRNVIECGRGLAMIDTGSFYHPELKIYHIRARIFDPEIGRFISRDPIGYGDGLNLYAGYFSVNDLDPSGTKIATNCSIKEEIENSFPQLKGKFDEKEEERDGKKVFVYSMKAEVDAKAFGWPGRRADNSRRYDLSYSKEFSTLTLQRMMNANYVYGIKGSNLDQTLDSLNAHLRARHKIILRAIYMKTIFGSLNDNEIPGINDTRVDWDELYEKYNDPEKQLMCWNCTLIAFMSGAGGRYRMRYYAKDSLVPGDWWYLRNKEAHAEDRTEDGEWKHADLRKWPNGTEGENLLFVGIDDRGDNQLVFFGHLRGKKLRYAKQWKAAVESFKDKKKERTATMEIGKIIRYPSAGIEYGE